MVYRADRRAELNRAQQDKNNAHQSNENEKQRTHEMNKARAGVFSSAWFRPIPPSKGSNNNENGAKKQIDNNNDNNTTFLYMLSLDDSEYRNTSHCEKGAL